MGELTAERLAQIIWSGRSNRREINATPQFREGDRVRATNNHPPQAILEMLPNDGSGPVFKEPWQARIFALVSQMYMDGHYVWDDFKDLLIDEIQINGADDGSDYYERWLAAAERLVTAKGMAETAALAKRKAHLAHHPPHPTTSDPGPIAVDPARKS